MTSQSGSGGLALGSSAGGDLSGTYPNPSIGAGKVPAELGYAQVITSQTGISATVLTDLTGLNLTVTVGTRPIMVECFLPQFDAGSSEAVVCLLSLFDVTGSAQVELVTIPTGGGIGSAATCKVRLTPVAGSRQYKAQARGDGVTAGRSSCGATQPAWLRIYEL